MSKIIKVVVTTEVIVPDSAEIVRIKDDDNIEAEYIRVAGKLAIPMIHWSEYVSVARREEEIQKVFDETGVKLGMSFEDIVDDEFLEEYLKEPEFPKHYLEETGEKIDDDDET
ncbi:MAG: hypothetical protein JNK23_12470 [Opitutaceae bacterium]|nr:hypothetical protein [Opitutaceae bacterium]